MISSVQFTLKEGRMAEWLRPRVFTAENGLNIRRISVGSCILVWLLSHSLYRARVANPHVVSSNVGVVVHAFE